MAYDFFLIERLHIEEDGHWRPARGPTRSGARPPPWLAGGPPLVLSLPNIFYSNIEFRGVSEYIKNIGRKKYQRGATHRPRGWGRALPPWARPLPHGPPSSPLMPIFGYMEYFVEEKIISKLLGRNSAATRRNLGGTNLGLRQSCSAGETSLGGGNHHHRHHQQSSHW